MNNTVRTVVLTKRKDPDPELDPNPKKRISILNTVNGQ
jgi:hypothetical protein